MNTNGADPRDWAFLRQRKGLSLRSIAESTNIAVRYLEAIEHGNFAKLPGGFYNISYIRQYAEALGCDAALVLEHYYAVTGHIPEIHPSGAAPEQAQPSLMDWLAPRTLLNVSMRRLRKI